jgi:small ligand-binding sensory domain FIST
MQCLLDKLTRLGGINSETLPVVMGGVTEAVSGAGEHVCGGSGVSLLAASLPGVELMPFHIDTPALPQLSAQQWGRLLTNVSHRRPRPRSEWSSTHIHVDSDSDNEAESGAGSSSSRLHNSTATLMLAAPHFTDVERLLQRFSNVLPGMPVLGGVTAPSAWGETEHNYGALFLGSRTFAQGAVGCVMHGPLAVQHLLVPGCRPVAGSRVMTVTANSPADPADILSLDGRPAQDPVRVELASTDRLWDSSIHIWGG